MRYIRTFFTALRMTLRGESVPESPHAPLVAWIQQANQLLSDVYATADKNGVSKSERQKILVRIDSRNMSAETILATIHHHISTEYLYLLRNLSAHSITAIYASNLNDRHFIARLKEANEFKNPAIEASISRLGAHLDAIPPTEKN
jgi:hypothetical protein